MQLGPQSRSSQSETRNGEVDVEAHAFCNHLFRPCKLGAVVSRRRHRPSRWRVIVWVTGITRRGRITSRGILFMIRGILTTVGGCIITQRMDFGLAVGIDGNLSKGTYAGEICVE
jgi:hypothetical protein